MRRIGSLCIFGFFMLLISCGASQGRSEKLEEAVLYFNEGVQWGRIQDVLSRLDSAAESHFLEMHRDFGKDLQVTGYEINSTKMDSKTGKAQIMLKITWYRLDEMEVHETVLLQHWEEKNHQWMMTGEEYVQGTPF